MISKPTLLILVDWFIPGFKAGGPIQSCVNLCRALQDQFNIYVLTTDTDHGDTMPYPGIPSNQWIRPEGWNIQVYYAKKKGLKPRQLAAVMQELQPDVVYLNHLFSPLFVLYPVWLRLRNRLPGRLVICPRGALFQSALSVKPWKKRPVLGLLRRVGLAGKVLFHATNQREQEAIRHYFPGASITIADNLPSMQQPLFVPIIKVPGKIRCIFIARLVPIKNLHYLLEVLKQFRSACVLTIVGPAEEPDYWNSCQALIRELPPAVTVEYAGARQAAELQGLLTQHHLFVLPTRGENFGHAIFEALLAGRPVLISDQTPWRQLRSFHAGWDLSLADPAAFAAVLEQVAAMDQETYDHWAKGAWQYAARYIQNNPNRQRYIEMFS